MQKQTLAHIDRIDLNYFTATERKLSNGAVSFKCILNESLILREMFKSLTVQMAYSQKKSDSQPSKLPADLFK